MPAPQAVQQPAPAVFQNVQPVQPAPVPAAQPPAPQPPLDIDPLAAAMAQQEAKAEQKAAKSLFEKAPVFQYGSAKEDIADPGMTFEELRIAKAEDFPELGEGKKVSWTVEYGKTVKPITDPKGTTIASVKSEIETSKAFLDNLKKAKDKNPDCLVKPKVTAQSKGIAAYKGVFSSLEEARASGKAICTIPGGDGRVYELRKSELGEFIAPKENVIDLPTVVAGFTPALPLVPMALLAQIISFFRCCMSGPEEFEALAHIFWDRQEEKFVAHIPKQRVTKAHIDADLSQDGLPEDRYLHYIDIHSHNSMTYVHDLDSKAFTRTLWQMCTECIVVFPDGVNVLPWMLCGTNEIGEATAEQMGTARLVVWAQHGIYGAGKDLDETFGLIETAEKAAEIYMKIAHLPLKTTITDDQMHQLEKHFGVKAREGWLD